MDLNFNYYCIGPLSLPKQSVLGLHQLQEQENPNWKPTGATAQIQIEVHKDTQVFI